MLQGGDISVLRLDVPKLHATLRTSYKYLVQVCSRVHGERSSEALFERDCGDDL